MIEFQVAMLHVCAFMFRDFSRNRNVVIDGIIISLHQEAFTFTSHIMQNYKIGIFITPTLPLPVTRRRWTLWNPVTFFSRPLNPILPVLFGMVSDDGFRRWFTCLGLIFPFTSARKFCYCLTRPTLDIIIPSLNCFCFFVRSMLLGSSKCFHHLKVFYIPSSVKKLNTNLIRQLDSGDLDISTK